MTNSIRFLRLIFILYPVSSFNGSDELEVIKTGMSRLQTVEVLDLANSRNLIIHISKLHM